VRDVGAEGREERRARRDRDLARRGRPLIDDVLRVAAAICVDAFAFVLWNLTARSPLRLAHDVAAGVRRLPVFLRGAFHLAVGALLLLGGGILLLPLVARGRDFIVIETIALVAALAVDQLVGPELRRHTNMSS
jgi:hypothetical protein